MFDSLLPSKDENLLQPFDSENPKDLLTTSHPCQNPLNPGFGEQIKAFDNPVGDLAGDSLEEWSLDLEATEIDSHLVDRLTGEALQNFAADPDFTDKMSLAFGDNWNREVVRELQQDWLLGDFSNIPDVQILSADVLPAANGAYSSETDTIYLSRDFLTENAANPAAVADVVLEEYGHAIDAKVNAADSAGDEGEIFASVVQGEVLSDGELLALKVEDDSGVITLDGEDVLIEMSSVFRGTVDAPVNIRSGPGTNFSVVAGLNSGSRTFDSVATGTTHWDNREGRNENRWFRIQGTNQWVSAAFITGNPVFNGTVDQTLNVRSGPGTNFPVIGSLGSSSRQSFDGVNIGTTHWDPREGKNENRWFRLQGTDRWVSAAFITGDPNYSSTPTVPSPPPSTSGYYSNIDSVLNNFFSKISGWSSKSIDEKWDRASGDSRQFGDTFYADSKEWKDTPNEVRAIYNDLSHAIFKTRKNMNTGYAFDAGYAPVYGYHSGIDLAATTNVDNVRAAVNGVVAVKPYHDKRRDGSSNGWWMAIDEVDAKGQETGRRWWYGHMAQEPKGFNLGTRVTGGETILAKAGMGHLHLAVQNVSGSITNGKTVQEVQNKSISPLHAYWKYKNGIKEARIWTL